MAQRVKCKVRITPQAAVSLRKMRASKTRSMIVARIDELKDTPVPLNALRIDRDNWIYRISAGSSVILYQHVDGSPEVLVLHIEHRQTALKRWIRKTWRELIALDLPRVLFLAR